MTYANLFPSRVGRLVLDGNVPPVEWNDAAAGASMGTFGRIQSPRGGEVALRMMLSECGKVDTARCAFSAGSPQATTSKYSRLLERLRARPVTVGEQEFTFSLTITTVAGELTFQNGVRPSGSRDGRSWPSCYRACGSLRASRPRAQPSRARPGR